MIDLKEKSIEIITKYQDKSGAYIACPNFDNYKYCWLRDGSFIAHSMTVSGRFDSAEMFFDWVHRVISRQTDRISEIMNMVNEEEPLLNSDYLPTRYKLDGEAEKDEWPNFQLDGYGTWLWALSRYVEAAGRTDLIEKYRTSIIATIDYIKCLWKSQNYDCWEENGDKLHPSTLSCLYGGLYSISKYVDDNNIGNTLNDIRNFILDNCIAEGRLVKYTGSESIDSSLIWAAVPFELFKPNDEIMKKTVSEIEKRLVHNHGVHRYPEDTYYGGGEWLLLAGFLGWYYAEAGELDKAEEFLGWIEAQADENGEMAEQVSYHVNSGDYVEKWKGIWGEVAKPLLWSHAMYLILEQRVNSK